MEVENRFITIKEYVQGSPSESDLEVRKGSVMLKVEEGSNDVVVKNIYASIDPYQINRMKKLSSSQSAINFATRLLPGQVSESTHITPFYIPFSRSQLLLYFNGVI